MKKVISIVSALLMVTASMTAFASSKSAVAKTSAASVKSDVTLSFYSNMTGTSSTCLANICKAFTQKTGITIEYSAPGSDYESILKTKMASGDLPDMWTTHGWSVARYSPYLKTVNGQPWYSKISKLIKPQITDKKGRVYVLPVDQDLAGIVYNVTVLKKCGIDAAKLTTWSAFEKACSVIKKKGITPVAIGNKDTWTVGQFFDWVAPSIYVTSTKHNYRNSLSSYKFNWNKWTTILQMFKSWKTKGYLNKDALTSDYNTITAQLGTGKVAFELFGNYAISDAKKANAKADIGFMPIPAYYAGDTPTLISGERLAVGVWKDTKYAKDCWQFLSYLATSSVMSKFCTVDGMYPGFTGVSANLGSTLKYYKKYSSVRTFPYFDRQYLPTGMWDAWCLTGANVLGGKSISSQISYLATTYKAKLAQGS